MRGQSTNELLRVQLPVRSRLSELIGERNGASRRVWCAQCRKHFRAKHETAMSQRHGLIVSNVQVRSCVPQLVAQLIHSVVVRRQLEFDKANAAGQRRDLVTAPVRGGQKSLCPRRVAVEQPHVSVQLNTIKANPIHW